MLKENEIPTKAQVAATKKIKIEEARVTRDDMIANAATKLNHEMRKEMRNGNTTFDLNIALKRRKDWDAYCRKASEEFVTAGWHVVVKRNLDSCMFRVKMTQPRFLKPKFCSRYSPCPYGGGLLDW